MRNRIMTVCWETGCVLIYYVAFHTKKCIGLVVKKRIKFDTFLSLEKNDEKY